MTKDLPSLWPGLIGVCGVCAIVVGLLLFRARRKKQRGERPPIETMLLRPPGHSLRIRLVEADEKMTNDFVSAVIIAAVGSVFWGYFGNVFFGAKLREWFAEHGGYSAMFKGNFCP